MSGGNNRKQVIVGLFLFTGLAILVAAVFMLGGQRSTFSGKFSIMAVFDDIGGLKTGDNVWLSGVKIGIVKNIGFTRNDKVLLTLSVEKKARLHIHSNAGVKIGSDGLMGNRIVIIYGGTAQAPLIADGVLLRPVSSRGAADMLATLDSGSNNLLAVTRNLRQLSNKALAGSGTVAALFNDSMLARNISHTAAAARHVMRNAETISDAGIQVAEHLETFAAQLNRKGGLVNSLVTDTGIYANLKESAQMLQHTMDSLQAFATYLKHAGSAFTGEGNTINTLLYDTVTNQHFKQMVRQLDAASRRLEEDLEALQHNFLLRGYFKRKARLQRK